jgi:hypothetical protein
MNHWRQMSTGLLVVALGVPFAMLHQGCGGPTFVVQQYAGPVRSRETIAIIRIEGADPVRVVSVDGEPLAPVDDDVRLHVEVLPGEHALGIANSAAPDQPAERVRFVAEAGRLYSAEMEGRGTARVFELDSSGAKLRDVSVVRSEPPERVDSPPPPPPPLPLPPAESGNGPTLDAAPGSAAPEADAAPP